MTQSRAVRHSRQPNGHPVSNPGAAKPTDGAALTVDLKSGAKVRVCRECFKPLTATNSKVCPGECARRRRNKLQNHRRGRVDR